jgi:hypothetical protein
MTTYSLELGFVDDQRSKSCRPAFAEIYVKLYRGHTEDGPPIITPECVTAEELEYQVERLKKELDAITTKARARFSTEAERTT